ncbi:DUF6276 family protein [Haloarcula salinisoli]|uniref:Small CPxCG-related zinc finger protein n=1 Tax=Haloarcula salinisoli TaxID=2487746 RepID=A0A8J7YFR7_9EURY|nr:DUF6276 family protein [Halomicroarcula salinisoli]MBX0287733.1 hypothetical protein [Halomicroarcula salinisoli]MBX0304657.1 hypothetical protein [Halomicroarcula salinisoli]
MSCQSCGGETVAVSVPAELREYLPGNAPAVAVCRACLAMEPADDVPGESPDLTVLDEAVPGNSDAAVPLLLLVGLLDSLALHRAEITALLERVEQAGTDPLLAVDRLADSYGDDAHVDLGRRRHQLEQLL